MVVGELWQLLKPCAMCWQVVVAMFYIFIEPEQIHVLCAASVTFVEEWFRRGCRQLALKTVPNIGLGTRKSSVWVHRRATCLVGKSWERHDKLKHGEPWWQSRLWVPTLAERRVHGLAVTYVDEDSADGLPALAGVRVLYQCGPWEHGTFTMQSRQQGRWGGAHSRVQNIPNRWYFWIYHQHEENNLASDQMRGSLLLDYVGGAKFHDVGCKRTCSPCFDVGSDTAANTCPRQLWRGWSDASWACRREGSSQSGHSIGITNTMFLKQAERIVSVVSWHSGKLARVRRSCKLLPMQKGSMRRSAPLKNCQKFVGQVSATVVLDARRVFGTLARSDSSCLGFKDNRSSLTPSQTQTPQFFWKMTKRKKEKKRTPRRGGREEGGQTQTDKLLLVWGGRGRTPSLLPKPQN